MATCTILVKLVELSDTKIYTNQNIFMYHILPIVKSAGRDFIEILMLNVAESN